MSTANVGRTAVLADGLQEAKPGNPAFGGRYQAARLLNKDWSGETYYGTDLVQSQPLVIKTVRADALSPVAHMRLEREATVLRELHGPRFPLLLDMGRDGDLVYLVMPLIQGVALPSRLSTPLAIREALTVGVDVCTTLQQVHERGVLHRDVKPGNILVDERMPLQWATLIDFGLARIDRLDVSIRDQPVETARYLSPEGAGLLDQDVDACSDLYSMGLVLFECLAGRPPFLGATVSEVLRQHMTVQPPELRALGLPVPRVLDEVVQRLLRKDPRDRYQSAAAVLADLRAIAEGLDNGVAEPEVVVGLHDRRRTLTEPAFVGRSNDLAALDSQVARARAGQGGLVFLEAESGGGKTRLLVELAQRTQRGGAWVLRGQGVDQMAQRPFQLLAGVTDELLAAACGEPALTVRLQEKLADQRDAVCTVLPELSEVLGTANSARLGPEEFAVTRTLQALSVLLDGLGGPDSPALVLLDDCQWADPLTLKLLGHWWHRKDTDKGAARHVLVVAAFRTEEVPAEHFLRTLQPSAHLTLVPFAAADVQQLAESMAGPLPAEALTVVQELGEGSPFMASAVLRGLVESGALVPVAAGWQVEPLALADISSSRHAAAFLARRLKLLSAPVLRLLSVGALLGKEFDLDIAASLADQTSSEAITALDDARQRHLVWVKAQEGKCVFVHDKLREALLDNLPAGERQDLHRQAGLFLEKHHGERHFDLAYHFDAAGESERALPHALVAAEHARSQHSLEIAEQQYRIAERGSGHADRATRFRIAEGLGDILMLRGRYDEAVRQSTLARDLAEGDVAKAQIEGKLGELAFKRGDMKTAIEANERALELLGHKVPQWSATFFLSLLRETVVQVLHTLIPKWFLARKPLDRVEKELLTIRLHNRLAYAYWFGRGKFPCLWTHLCAINLAELYPPTLELAQSYSHESPIMCLLGHFSRGIAYTQKSFAICKSLGDLWGQAQSLQFNGMILHVASRFEECIEKCREAVRLSERTGDVWDVNIARYHIAYSLYRRGDLPAAVAEAKRIHQSGLELGDIQATGICLHVWVQASGGQVPAEIVQTELQRERYDIQVGAQVHLAEGVRLFILDRVEEAAELFETGQQLAESAGAENAWTFPLGPWLASALRRQVEKTSSWEPERRTSLLKQASRVAKKALKVARTFQNDLPHALREAGLIAALQGSAEQARQHLDESLAVAERQGARFEHAQTLLARGRIGLVLGWSQAEEDVQSARQTLQALGAEFALDTLPAPAPAKPATLSLADRFDTVLDAGRRIASALSSEAIFQAVREAALHLLRGERCMLVDIKVEEDSADLIQASSAIDVEYRSTMAERARTLGKVVVFAEGQSAAEDEAALLVGVRSALCAPIFVRGNPIGCFYVEHRHVARLFGEDEERLAEFIATIAGAALENAEGFAEMRHLNETLEERVAERTAAAEAWAKEMARSNAELQQFAFIASHDLQEPLRKVQTFGDLLLAESAAALSKKGRDYLQRMQGAAKRMQELINDILTLGRVTSQAKPFVRVDLNRVVREVLSDLEARVQCTGGRVEPGDLPHLDSDPLQMRQLMQNLIGNALKFHHPGVPPVVAVQGRVVKNGDGFTPEPFRSDQICEITVRDNGIGIEEKYLDRIFLPFQRLHGHGEYEGTGMGLAICRKIVERHGGTLTARSTPGQGTTFVVRLPLSQPKGKDHDA